MNWNIFIISLSVALAILGIYKEVRRPNRAKLPLRLLAVTAAIIGLACIALPLTYQKQIKTDARKKIVLLTQGFNKDSLKGYEDALIFTFDTTIAKSYRNAKLVTNIGEAATDASERQLHILGYGVDNGELTELHKNFIFHPSPSPNGLTALNWTDQLKSGEQLQVQGSLKNTSTHAVTIALTGLGSTLDSVTVRASITQTFAISATPKHTDRAVYHLIGLNKTDTLFNEQIPVTVTPAVPLRLLLLTSSPDFETKFLKNWLGANGYAVASRSLISKGKYSQETVNMGKTDLAHISSNLLDKFDLVVSDVPAISALSASENSALQNAVSNAGLGLLLRADSADKLSTWPVRGFSFGRIAGRPAASALQVTGKGKSAAKLVMPSSFIYPNNNQQVLVRNQQNQALAANALYGSGKLGVTLINQTFNWMLEGAKNDYANLWTAVIDKTARKQKANNNLWVKPQFPVIGQAAEITSANLTSVNGISVAAKQNAKVPFEQTATYWPNQAGWQQTIANGKTYWWFAWPKHSWLSIKATEKLNATKAYAAAHRPASNVTKQIQEFTRVPVPKIYFYILFLVAAAFLWAEAKHAGY